MGTAYGANPVRFVRFLPEDNLRFEILSEEQEKALLLMPHRPISAS